MKYECAGDRVPPVKRFWLPVLWRFRIRYVSVDCFRVIDDGFSEHLHALVIDSKGQHTAVFLGNPESGDDLAAILRTHENYAWCLSLSQTESHLAFSQLQAFGIALCAMFRKDYRYYRAFTEH